jgi:NADPH:quinone reductase-like Zn-dependent oxidoreductase
MKAIAYQTYGSPDVLQYLEIDRPTPRDNEVLIRIHAASANPLDWHLLEGGPYIIRLLTGLGKPKMKRPGVDVAGRVEATGRNVTQFKKGDAVFGVTHGTFAEYVCAAQSAVVLKPDNVTFAQVASVPIAAITALQGLRDKGRIRAGSKVLINGAAGGVGTFAVQIAITFGAEVTGVCSTRNVDLVQSIGADHVIDYTRGDFTQSSLRYDLVFDCVGNHSMTECRQVLGPRGIYVLAGAKTVWAFLTAVLKAPVLSRFFSQTFVAFIARVRKEDLAVLSDLLGSGKVNPVIDRQYTLQEVPEALRYLAAGHARGKVVITLE